MNRKAFTLIEILVVIAIITIIASLGFVMVKRFGVTAREDQTYATLKKINASIQDRLQSMDRYFTACDRRAAGVSIPNYVEDASDRQNWITNKSEIEVIAKKKFERKHFPMNFDEPGLDSSGNSLITGLAPGFMPPLHDSNSPDADTENSEVLYWFLKRNTSFGSEMITSIDFTDREIADTDDDGLMEVVDGWGNPIRFYRWPTRLIRPQLILGTESVPITVLDDSTIHLARATDLLLGDLPSNLKSDPDDPTELIRVPADQFESPLMLGGMEFHTKNTWHSPLLISAGSDGSFGLFSPTKDRTSFGYLAQPKNLSDPTIERDPLFDNLTNFHLRVGGK